MIHILPALPPIYSLISTITCSSDLSLSYHWCETVKITLQSPSPRSQTKCQVLIPTSGFIGFISTEFLKWIWSSCSLSRGAVSGKFSSHMRLCVLIWLVKHHSQQDTLDKTRRNVGIRIKRECLNRGALNVICLFLPIACFYIILPMSYPFWLNLLDFWTCK